MARTRAQAQNPKSTANEKPVKKTNETAPNKRKQAQSGDVKHVKKKTKTGPTEAEEEKLTKPEPDANAKEEKITTSKDNTKIRQLISTYGVLPLDGLGLPEPTKPSPENVLTLVFNAMLTSTRISHNIANESVKCLIEAGYHKLDTLEGSSWQERTEVLTKGGYTHYREKTATSLGELAMLVKEKRRREQHPQANLPFE